MEVCKIFQNKLYFKMTKNVSNGCQIQVDIRSIKIDYEVNGCKIFNVDVMFFKMSKIFHE